MLNPVSNDRPGEIYGPEPDPLELEVQAGLATRHVGVAAVRPEPWIETPSLVEDRRPIRHVGAKDAMRRVGSLGQRPIGDGIGIFEERMDGRWLGSLRPEREDSAPEHTSVRPAGNSLPHLDEPVGVRSNVVIGEHDERRQSLFERSIPRVVRTWPRIAEELERETSGEGKSHCPCLGVTTTIVDEENLPRRATETQRRETLECFRQDFGAPECREDE